MLNEMTNEEARTRVARGAAYLDANRPGWFNRIDVGTLTMHCPLGCILGQLDGNFWLSIRRLGWCDADWFVPENSPASALGFSGTGRADVDHPKSYVSVQDAWIEAIADRRLSQEVTTLRTVVAVPESAVLVASRP